jgi:tRNA threonylcarbamoyladenosine biosynthesis protein TsaE
MEFNIGDIKKISQKIIKYLESIVSENATVLAFYGNLGAGKTTLTQNIAGDLGIKDVVNSPTFVIQKKYKINGNKYKNLIHIDAYRLSSFEETKVLGLEEEFNKKENIIIIEWPENIKEILPKDLINIYLEHTNDIAIRDIRVERQGTDITTII